MLVTMWICFTIQMGWSNSSKKLFHIHWNKLSITKKSKSKSFQERHFWLLTYSKDETLKSSSMRPSSSTWLKFDSSKASASASVSAKTSLLAWLRLKIEVNSAQWDQQSSKDQPCPSQTVRRGRRLHGRMYSRVSDVCSDILFHASISQSSKVFEPLACDKMLFYHSG